MNTQIESKPVVTTSVAAFKAENPMQEQHFGQVAESVEVSAEAAFMARSLEARAERGDAQSPSKGRSTREDAGPVFVP